jgi:hypothetical protein
MESLVAMHHKGDPYIRGSPRSSDVPVPAGMFDPRYQPGCGEIDPVEGGPVAV